MEISSGESRGGEVFLKVRPATKNHLGESWETIPGTGSFIEVATAADARAIRVQSDQRGPTSRSNGSSTRASHRRVRSPTEPGPVVRPSVVWSQ
jgi:hypothetical protein